MAQRKNWLVAILMMITFIGLSKGPLDAPSILAISTPAPIGTRTAITEKEMKPEFPLYSPQDFRLSSVAKSISPQATGGPDDFGYTWNDSVTFTWIDATNGINTGLQGDDQFTGPIDIGFNFRFYTKIYTQVYVSTNGLLTFGEGYYQWINQPIPYPTIPNNFIAPFWDDLCVNYGGYNSGAVYYKRGGTSPNRYFVVEWYQISRLGSGDLLIFEVILYENGDIQMQYLSLTGNLSSATVGIEDDLGLTGLQYLYNSPGLSNNKAIRFYYPSPEARVQIWPAYQSHFSTPSATEPFQVNIRNIAIFTDTYDIFIASSWSTALYAPDAVPLTDTDGDYVPDTGPLAPGDIATIMLKMIPPSGASVGDTGIASLTVRSSRDTSKTKTATFQATIPAPFAQVYTDYANGAISIYAARPKGTLAGKVTPDWYYGYDQAIAEISGGNFFFVWSKGAYSDNDVYFENVEYAVTSPCGQVLRTISKLTDNSGATRPTGEYAPAVSVAPNGRIGLTWYRYLWDSFNSKFNYNIYFAILDPSGNLIYGPLNLTNNNTWGTWDDLNVPNFRSPQIAATGDNRFVIAWLREHRESNGWVDDIYYTVRDSYGNEVRGTTRMTSDTPGDSGYYAPVLTPLTYNRVFLSWVSRQEGNDDIHYAILKSDGSIFKGDTDLSIDESVVDWWNYDAVQLSDGKILAVWEAWGCFPGEWTSRIRFALLDTSYNRIGEPQCLGKAPTSISGDTGASVTADWSGHGIITWTDRDYNLRRNLYYALVDSSGNILTPPMEFISGKGDVPRIATNFQGYGNTSFSQYNALICRNYIPLTLRDYFKYFEGPWEQEPNNSAQEANGPLRSGRDYYGYPNDAKDYFSIYLRRSGTISIKLDNHTGSGVQLQLFYQTTDNRVIYDSDAPYQIDYTGPAGLYYIYIYTAGNYNSTTPYTLRVTYPQ